MITSFPLRYFRIHSGEKPYKCSRIDQDCSKAFSTPHSLKSHLKTHEKRMYEKDRKKEFVFTANTDLLSSSDDSMIFSSNQINMMQFEITDSNGNNLKYSTPNENFDQQVFLEQKTNEAMQLQMANEVEEMGNDLIGVSVLPNDSVMPTSPVTSSCYALSTSVPTFVDLPTFQVNQDNSLIQEFFNNNDQHNDQAMKELDDLLMTNNFENDIKSTLKSITADAGKLISVNSLIFVNFLHLDYRHLPVL